MTKTSFFNFYDISLNAEKNGISSFRRNTQKMCPLILKNKIICCAHICIEDMIKGIFLVFFLWDLVSYFGTMAVQTILLILQKKPRSITDLT